MTKFQFILLVCFSLFFVTCKKEVTILDLIGEYEGTAIRITENTRTYLSQTTNQMTTDVTIYRDTFPELLKFELGQEEDEIILTQGSSFTSGFDPITLTKENQSSSITYSFDESWRDFLAEFYPNQNKLHFSTTRDPGGYGNVVINSRKTELFFEGLKKK